MSWRDRFRRLNQRSLFGSDHAHAGTSGPGQPEPGDLAPPPNQVRAEAMQRLQIGMLGIGSMVLLVGLASIIGSQADLADEAAVPEAAPTTEPTAAPPQANPLADAGVVPDIAAEPSPSPAPPPMNLPPPRPARPDNAAPAP